MDLYVVRDEADTPELHQLVTLPLHISELCPVVVVVYEWLQTNNHNKMVKSVEVCTGLSSLPQCNIRNSSVFFMEVLLTPPGPIRVAKSELTPFSTLELEAFFSYVN